MPKLSVDRWDPQCAQEIFRGIFPDHDVAQSVCRLLAESIRIAHETGPGSWSISLFEGKVRLNVGQVEVCTLRDNRDCTIHIVACAPASQPQTRGVTILPGVYRSVPVDQVMIELDETARGHVHPVYIEAHHAFIREAATRKKGSPFRQAFSLGVLLFLEEVLHTSLPRPSFLQGLEPVSLPRSADEVLSGGFYEGAVRQITVNAYERDARARQICIEQYGARCAACGMSFGEVYGESMDGFIHVHHLRPISEIGSEYRVDPTADLRPVCPNCHAVIHNSSSTRTLALEELRALIGERCLPV